MGGGGGFEAKRREWDGDRRVGGQTLRARSALTRIDISFQNVLNELFVEVAAGVLSLNSSGRFLVVVHPRVCGQKWHEERRQGFSVIRGLGAGRELKTPLIVVFRGSRENRNSWTGMLEIQNFWLSGSAARHCLLCFLQLRRRF